MILLDVIMETDDAGLVVAKHIRKILNNNLVRIVLRTGQAGKVPEELVIVEYDIDDYKAKADLTAQKLFTTVITALRAFRALVTIESKNAEKIDRVKVKGKSEAVIVYEVFDGDAAEVRERKLATTELFVKAWEFYNLQNFREAQELFQDVLTINSRDKVAQIYLKRCQQHYCELS